MDDLNVENPIVIGCNYHTTWQSDPQMRFVLDAVKGDKARLKTRKTRKSFWTDVKDLVFIQSSYNREKAKNLIKKRAKKALK